MGAGGKAPGSWIGDRGIFGGSGAGYPTTQYINIPTTGNATNWASQLHCRGYQPGGCCAHDSRMIWMGGAGYSSNTSTIAYMSFTTNANSVSGGNLNTSRNNTSACSSKQGRGICMGGGHSGWGYNEYLYMDYVAIATIGQATSFGNISARRDQGAPCVSNGTIGMVGGGYLGGGPGTLTIDYVTFATTGNSSNYGNLICASNHDGLGNAQQGSSNSTRACVYGGTKKYTGYTSYSSYNVIQYINMTSTGNAAQFGALFQPGQVWLSCFGNKTRGCWGGGQTNWPNYVSGSPYSTSWYIDYATTSNSNSFGNLSSGVTHVYGNGAANKA